MIKKCADRKYNGILQCIGQQEVLRTYKYTISNVERHPRRMERESLERARARVEAGQIPGVPTDARIGSFQDLENDFHRANGSDKNTAAIPHQTVGVESSPRAAKGQQ